MSQPIHISPSTVKSLWQEYRIFSDRLEFETHLGLMTIPFDHIEGIQISEGEVQDLMRGDLHLKDFRPALKLDWANFTEHLVLDKDQGAVRRILFTPEDLDGFRATLQAAIARYRAG